MAKVPQELLVEILSRLPVESSLRFKCVCKSWYALIGSQKFVSKHIANQSKDHVVLMHNAGGNFMSFLSNTGSYGDDVSCIVDAGLDLKCPLHEYECCDLLMHGYCDGIVVLSDFGEDIILCNPGIKEIRLLPKSTSFLRYISGQNPLYTGTSSIGFGYDPKMMDYKVIRVMAFWADEDHNCRLADRAEVFSLHTDSTWREINSLVGAQLYYSDDLEQYFDGFHYWCGLGEDPEKHVFLSFDMANEVFQKASMPDVCDRVENVMYLGILKNETIALFVWPKDGFEKCIDVWVMKEFGLKESWTKQLTMGPLEGLERPLAFWKNDKELLQEDRKGKLVSFDLASRDSKRLPIHYEFSPFMSWRAYLYMKTLVSVNGNKDDNII